MSSRPYPLRPDPDALADATITTLVRTCIAATRHKLDRSVVPAEYARRQWGTDEARPVEFLLRAAVSPAQLTVPGWAAELANVVVHFLPALVPVSAGAALLQRGLQLAFDGAAVIRLPLIHPGKAVFIGEAKPIPVVDLAIDPGVVLEPHKLATISTLTREMIDSSNAESIVRQVLIESVGAGLDAVLFSALAANADHPAGLLQGVSALPPSANPDKTIAMVDDLAAVVGSVARIAGSGPIVIVCAPEQAASIELRYLKEIDYSVLPSAALPPGSIIAIAVNALASALSGLPQIEASREAALIMDDTPPANGSPATMSLFQTDSVGLKVRMQANWTLRASGAIAYVTGAAW